MTIEVTGIHQPDTRRFQTKADAFYVRHDEGVWLGNNAGSCTVRGKDAYQLVNALFTNLDGERSLDDVCSGLPDTARRSVRNLVDTLARHGFLKEIRHPKEPVPPWMRDRYAAHLAFLDHHADRPVTRMTRVRSRLVVCAGEGTALLGLLGALNDFGVARVRAVTGTADEAAVAETAAEVQAADPQCAWQVHIAGHEVDPGALEADDADIVLLAYDRDDERIADAQQALRGLGHAVGVLGRCGDFVVSMPPSPDNGWCWDCVRRSIAGRVTGNTAGLAPAVAPATIAALRLVQHTFARLAEVDIPGGELVTTVEPIAPVVRTHTGRRHPLCLRHPAPAAAAGTGTPRRDDERVRPDVPAAHDPAELVAMSDRIVAVTSGWTDQVAGPLLALGEGGTDQLPLSTSACRVADPSGTADAPATREFTLHALSPREARNQVVLSALEWLGTAVHRLTRAAGEDQVIGAGWSRAEALYRALANASLALPAYDLAWSPAPPPEDTGSSVREFLTDALTAAGRPWQQTALETLPTGFLRAWIRTADGRTAAGVGVNRTHAIEDALLSAAAFGRSTRLAPPCDTWAQAVALAGGQEGADATELLPFLGGQAQLVAVAPAQADR